MMKKENIKNYFAGSNTPEGFYSFYKYLPFNSKKIYIIKGGPGTGKSTFMKNIGNNAIKKGYDIELHHCSSDNNSIDGIVIPDLSTAFLDGTAPHTVDPIYPAVVEEIIDFGQFWNKEILLKSKKEIIKLTDQTSNYFNQAYQILNKNQKKYELQKRFYKEFFDINMFIDNTDNLISKIINENSSNKKPSNTYNSSERHLFSTAITPQGVISYLDEISKQYNNRYIILGQLSHFISLILKKLAKKTKELGYYVLYLHSTCDPTKINGIVIPDLHLTAINGSFPKNIEYDINKVTVLNIDMYLNKNKSNEKQLKSLEKIIDTNIEKAIIKLKKAKKTHDILEKYYINSMNFEKLNNFTNTTINTLF